MVVLKHSLQFLLPSASISERNIPLYYAKTFMSYFRFTMPITVLFLQQYLPNSQVAGLSSWLFASHLLLELPTGVVADLLGKRGTIIVGFLVSAAANILFALSTSFWGFFVVFSMFGLGESLTSGANEAILYDTLKQDGKESAFKRINANAMLLAQLGFVAGTFIGGWLGSIDLRLPFVLYSVVLLVSVLLAYLIREPAIDTQQFTLRNYIKQTIAGFKQLTKSEWITWLSLLYVLIGGIGWTFQRLMNQILLIEVGFMVGALGIILGSFRLLNMLILKKFASLSHDVFGSYELLLLPVLMVISYLPGVFFSQYTSLPFVAGAMMIGTARFIILNPHVNAVFDSKYRATALSSLYMLVSLVLIISMTLAGWLAESYGAKMVFTLYGVFSLLVVIPVALKVFWLSQSRSGAHVHA